MDLQQVLVGVDGSPNAQRAVEWTARFAQMVGAKVVAVHALGLLAHSDGGELVPAQPLRAEEADHLQREWCAPLVDAGVEHRCVVRDGSAVSAVLSAADELDVDLIVVGSRGLGAHPEMLLGSTSTQVAQRSTRPVVIVPDEHPRS